MTKTVATNTAIQAIKGQLTTENEAYMRDLHGYLLISNIFSDEAQVMEQLLQLYSDVLAAQVDGLSAEAFLGKDPKGMADELSRQFSRQRGRDFLWQTVHLFLIFEWCQGMIQVLFEGRISFNPWLLFVDLLIAVIMPWLLWGLRHTFYRAKGEHYGFFMLLGGLWAFLFMGRGFLDSQLSERFLSPRLSLALLGSVLVAYLCSWWLKRRQS